MTNLSLYVGTYHKYNNASLFGEWIDLSKFSNLKDFYSHISELHKDEEDPEFMFQDYECPGIIEKLGLIGESYLSDEIFEILQAIEESDFEEEVLEAFLDCFGQVNDIHELIEKVEESYQGEFSSDAEFTQDLVEQTETYELPSYIQIDWEGTARDIMMDYSASGGYYFRC